MPKGCCQNGCIGADTMQLAVELDSAIIPLVADVLCRREIPGNGLQIHVAHVAELADALDSGSSE